MYVAKGRYPGMLKPGNIDLTNRPVAHNKDGSISTVRSITIGPENGHYILLPTVIGGRVVSNQKAIRYAQRTKEHLGFFNSERAADSYSEALHDQQARMYLPKRPKLPRIPRIPASWRYPLRPPSLTGRR